MGEAISLINYQDIAMTRDYQTFLKQQAYIDGQWCLADNAQVLPVYNPFDQSLVGHVPNMGGSETTRAIDAAAAALVSWSKLTALVRADYLLKWHDLILTNKAALATLMTLEQGKPLAEAVGEIEFGASFIRWFAEEGRRTGGDIIPTEKDNLRYLVIKQPIGVVAAITPWNFPTAMLTRKCAPALAAGCTMVIKPSELTPFSALALAALAEQAGIPKGVLNIVMGDAKAIGDVLCGDARVRKLTFTGSTNIGKLLYRQCAGTVKKLSLELGGNAPVLVFDDADLDKAVAQVMAAKFRNSGQTCVCANRIFVQTGIYDRFVAAMTVAVQNLSLGNGLSVPPVLIGPLINEAAITKIQALVDQAVSKGATVVYGGHVDPLGRQFYTPTLIVNADVSMDIAQDEIFGPVAVIYRFETEAQAITWANSVPVGLAAYCFTANIGRTWRVSEQLAFGIVSVNTGLFSNATTPFGGVKESGLGREGSKYGIEDYLDIKYICLDIN